MHALYPGSFDPVTLGHCDIIARAARLFETVTVAIGRNSRKQGLFSEAERVALLRAVCAPHDNVEVACFDGLIVEFASRRGAGVLVRGLRNCGDFEFELTMALTNRALSDVETVFLVSEPRFGHVSSTLVKEIARYGGDVSAFVPAEVDGALRSKLQPGGTS